MARKNVVHLRDKAKLIPLGQVNCIPGPNEEIIEELTSLLKKAKRGDITAFAYTALDPADFICSGIFIGSVRLSRLVAGASSLLYRLNKAYDEASE